MDDEIGGHLSLSLHYQMNRVNAQWPCYDIYMRIGLLLNFHML